MSKLDDLLVKFTEDLEGIGEKVDAKLLHAVAKACGPSIYRADAKLVAASDPKEVDRVKKNFCIKKLGVADNEKLDEGIKEVLKSYNKRQKQRAVVYYLLVKKFRKSSVFK
ncbi:MAG: DUF2853 family protein [Verrucomicrobiota bacterium]